MKKEQIIALCIFVFISGFAVGRKTIEAVERVVYVRGDTVKGEAATIDPVSETVPDNPVLPLLLDTVYLDRIVYIRVEVDTAAIINDYITSREYMPVLFDTNTLGKLSLLATVQYNRLSDVQYEFSPVYKEITKYRVPVWQPFVGTSVNTFSMASLSVGTFYKNIGFETQFIYDFERLRKGYGIGIRYKF